MSVESEAEQLLEAALQTEKGTAVTIARAARELVQYTPPKFLVGVSTVLAQAAHFVPAVEQAAHDFRFAYWRKTLHPDSWISDLLLLKKAKALKEALAQAADKADTAVRAQIKAEMSNVDTAIAWLPVRGVPRYSPKVVTKLGKLETGLYSDVLRADPAYDALRKALARWHEATSGFDEAELAAAGDDLCSRMGVLGTKKSSTAGLGPSAQYVRAVQRATRALAAQIPSQDALAMLARLGDAVAELLREQRAAGIGRRTLFWRHLMPAIESSPNAWARVGRKLASLKPVKASDAEAVTGMVMRLRAALAEAVGTASPRYRSALARSLRRGETLAATLNTAAAREGVEPAWKVVKPLAAMFAPGTSKNVGKLFVDDAILVVNESFTPPRAYLLFAGQVKAGDASSRNAVGQLIEDQIRLFQGSLTIAGREYAMVPPTDLAWVQRAFVGTTRPSGAGQLAGLVEHIDAPLDAAELDRLALSWLRKAGKVTD
jgi:hypothetical protein